MLKLIKHLRFHKKKVQRPKHSALWCAALPTCDWADLPNDALYEIAKRICYVDLPSFAAVCKSWRLAYSNYLCSLPKNIPFGVPILLLNASKQDQNSRKFIRMNGELVRDGIFLPETANKFVCGSSWGWLVLADIHGVEVILLNPITRRLIHLPTLDTFSKRINLAGELDYVPIDGKKYICKVILSTNPSKSEEECIVVAIVGGMRKLSYCRIGDKKWTNVENCLPELSDVIYHEGKFYAITETSVLMSCSITDSNSRIKIIALGHYMHPPIFEKKYISMVSGCLFLVSRGHYNFAVHALNKRSSPVVVQESIFPTLQINNPVEVWHEWVKTDSIGNNLLFVGNNDSFSLPARMYSKNANCIYFTENAFGVLHDEPHNKYIGVHYVGKFFSYLYNGTDQNELLPSFWMTPMPW